MAAAEIENSDFQIDHSIAHLLHRIGQIAADSHSRVFGRNGLSARQFAVLSALAKSPEISQTDLVQITNIDRSTMAEVVKRLLGKNLIIRDKSKSDARANVLKLSDEGQKLYIDALPRIIKIDQDLLSKLSEKNKGRIFEILYLILGDRAANTNPPKEKKPKKDKKPTKSKALKKAKKLKL